MNDGRRAAAGRRYLAVTFSPRIRHETHNLRRLCRCRSRAFLGQLFGTNEIHFYPNPKHIHSQRPISTYSLNMNFVCTWISFRLYEKSHRRGTNAKCGIIKWRVLYTTDVYENLRRQQHGPIITWTNHNNYTELTVLILSWSKTLIYDLTTRL